VIYSDRQPTSERSRRNNDEDYNRCECGCGGEDGRCSDQIHNDGDCNSNECHRCCENGDCLGTPRCCNCQDRAHDDLEYCGSPTCNLCNRAGRIPRELPLEEATPASQSGEAGDIVTVPFYGASVPDGIVIPISGDEMVQSRDRESFYNGGTR